MNVSFRWMLLGFMVAAGFLGGTIEIGRAAGPEDVPLIPREKFFGNPEKARARLSPDGKRLAYVAPVEGVLNVWVSPDDDPAKAKPVTFDKHRGIFAYSWAVTSKHILYTQDKNGDEDDHVYSVNLDTGEIKDLTPIEKIAAEIDSTSERFPDEILVGIAPVTLGRGAPLLPRRLTASDLELVDVARDRQFARLTYRVRK